MLRQPEKPSPIRNRPVRSKNYQRPQIRPVHRIEGLARQRFHQCGDGGPALANSPQWAEKGTTLHVQSRGATALPYESIYPVPSLQPAWRSALFADVELSQSIDATLLLQVQAPYHPSCRYAPTALRAEAGDSKLADIRRAMYR